MLNEWWGKLTEVTSKPLGTKETFDYHKNLQRDIIARTIWGETRGSVDSYTDMEAVASIILNRTKISEERGKYWWGNGFIQVCQKPYQFIGWNRSSSLYKDIIDVTGDNYDFEYCLGLADEIIKGTFTDTTFGATHCHVEGVSPYWARDEVPTLVGDGLIFYKLVS